MKETAKLSALSAVCPYLGLKNDPSTSLTYPEKANHCFRCRPAVVPRLEHQTGYCLVEIHETCPVYNQPEGRTFPVSLRLQDVDRRMFGLPFIQTIMIAIGFFAIISFFGIVVQSYLAGKTSAVPTGFESRVPRLIDSPSLSPTQTEFPTNTFVPVATRLSVSLSAFASQTPPFSFTPTLTLINSLTPSSTIAQTQTATFNSTSTPTLPSISTNIPRAFSTRISTRTPKPSRKPSPTVTP